MREQEVRASVAAMDELDRELYHEHLEMAKAELSLPVGERSLPAANLALARTIENRRIRRAKGFGTAAWVENMTRRTA